MQKTSESEILTGSILKNMLKIGWPVMVSTLLDTLYQLTNTFWLGRLKVMNGADEMAGLQIAFPVIWFFIAFINGFAMAGIAMVSQFTGAGKRREADRSSTQILALTILSGVLIGVAGFFSVPLFMDMITSEKKVVDAAISYMRVFFAGLPFLCVVGVFRAMLSAVGDTVTPLLLSIGSNIVNIILAPLFITGAGMIAPMGASGAALTTNISVALASFAAFFILIKGKKGVSLYKEDLKPDFEIYRQIVKIGFPAAVASSLEAFGFVILMTVIGRLDNARDALSGYGVGERFIGICFIATSGLGQGLMTIIGQTLGAGNIKRAEKAANQGISLLFITLLVESAFIVIFREELMSLFVPAEKGVIFEGMRFLLYFGLSIPLFGIVTGIQSAFSAAGSNMPVLIISACRLWVFRLPFAYILAYSASLGAKGVWFGMALSNILAAFVALYYFKKGSWKKRLIED